MIVPLDIEALCDKLIKSEDSLTRIHFKNRRKIGGVRYGATI